MIIIAERLVDEITRIERNNMKIYDCHISESRDQIYAGRW